MSEYECWQCQCFYMNSFIWSVIKNHNYIYYIKKIYKISTNIYLKGNNGFRYGVYIDDMLPESAPNQYVNMGYNN